ncbi:hypothetical protein QVD17_07179 [Tagetes erecta]|uniref:Uncharacterized protein n=1 Tax=Tagetes erecta TaxID=13708 RepID=A0AAD8PCQ3_TARER|nr:hypothetical protein QVD17_07179 [Tagetes erecta]
MSGAFPPKTIFRAFDARAKSDFTSPEWVCFPAFPFGIGYTYPFPEFTARFFEVTGLSYAQTMPMIWRTLFTIEEIKRNQVVDFDLAELAYAYDIRAHGSNRFLLNIKPHQPHLVLKNTQNDPYWKYRFFFVKRSSLPDGEALPTRWLTKALKLSELAPPVKTLTYRRVTAFLALDAEVRSFRPRTPEPEEISSTNISETNMSGSLRSGSRFLLDEIDSRVSKKKAAKTESEKPIEIKGASSSIPPKPTPGKKRKSCDDVEPSMFSGMDFIETDKKLQDVLQAGRDQLIKCYNETLVELHEAERTISDMKRMVAMRAKVTAQEKEALKLELETKHAAEMGSMIETAKDSAALAVYEARLKMVKEANNPDFDRSLWKIEVWESVVADLKEKLAEEDTRGQAGSSGPADDDKGKQIVAVKAGVEKVVIQDDKGDKDKACVLFGFICLNLMMLVL